ncbi:MAG TPA: hypothetical protein VN822_08775 [Candidatus Acidoferrales bacterium]|nr:hypothetical protein [Candidatus Acidoferrales bacterium]
MTDLHEERMALISILAERSPKGSVGRTGVMKFLYFLQTLRDVPLEYRFTLYSYGPFDAEVLSDLANAEALEVVNSTIIQFSGGYGYEIRPGRNAKWLQERSAEFLSQRATITRHTLHLIAAATHWKQTTTTKLLDTHFEVTIAPSRESLHF